MIYQLIQYSGDKFNFVEQSPALTNDAAKAGWFKHTTEGKTLPEGYQWGMIEPGHPWFNNNLNEDGQPNQTTVGNQPDQQTQQLQEQSKQQALQQYGQKAEGYETIEPEDPHFVLDKSDNAEPRIPSNVKYDSKELPQDEASVIERQKQQDAKRAAEIERNRPANPNPGNPSENLNIGVENPSFNEIMRANQRRWSEERKSQVDEQEALGVVLRNFKRRK